MKKLLLLAVMVLFVFGVVACGGGTDTSESDTGAEVVEEPAAEEEMVEEPAAETEEEMTDETEGEASGEMDGTMAELSDAPEACQALPLVDPLNVTGDIIVAGSSTVFPLTQAMADRFTDEGYEGQITIDSIGSGAGFERFCVSAETDISNASRPINEDEVASCQENGLEPIEIRVGTDALAVVVNQENDFVDDLTIEQLAQIFSGEAATWQDVNPEWPAEQISVFTPGEDSGTFDYFVEEVYDEDPEPLLGNTNAQFSEDDNVLAQGVAGGANAIAYFGYAYFTENDDVLRTVNIEGIEPNAETAESNEYPLSRPLFIYTAPSIVEAKPHVAQFVNYYLNFVNEEITGAGYFPASEEAISQACDAIGEVLQ